jgi:acetyltransferase-like isoleucine patch superfamily enzyme
MRLFPLYRLRGPRSGGLRRRLGAVRAHGRVALAPWRLAVRRDLAVSPRARIDDPRFVRIRPGAKIGAYAELWAFSDNPAGGSTAVEIAEDADIRSHALLHAYGGSIRVGRYSCVNHFCFVNGAGGVWIGDDVMMGTHTAILSSEHGMDDLPVPMTRQPSHVSPVVIEDDVYIGAHVTILAGITIGTGAIVAAGAVVTRDVEPYAVVGGVPARVLRSRRPAGAGAAL